MRACAGGYPRLAMTAFTETALDSGHVWPGWCILRGSSPPACRATRRRASLAEQPALNAGIGGLRGHHPVGLEYTIVEVTCSFS
jgi:hypothetical protein